MVTSSRREDLRLGAVTAERHLFLALPAALTAAAEVRALLGAWLTTHGWPPAAQEDLVLAVNEAVSNSVEHGYGVQPGAAGQARLKISSTSRKIGCVTSWRISSKFARSSR